MTTSTEQSAARLEDAVKAGDLVGYLLREQQNLSAVEQFSREHDQLERISHPADAEPAQAKYYRALMHGARPWPTVRV